MTTSTNISSITWAESGGTPVSSVEDLPAGSTVTLTIDLYTAPGATGTVYTPANGDYVTLNNGGEAVYTNGVWVYTVGATDGTGDLSVATPLKVNIAAGGTYKLSPVGGNNGTVQTYTPLVPYDVICFYPGTLIATPEGECAVETMKIGDLVLTTDGKAAPVRWVGRQTVSTRFANPQRVLPIRVTAGALAEGVPARDLLLSPDHALLVDGALVQACALINGVSIVRETNVPVTFTYYHVELADHSLILAENAAAETFVDNVERMGFDNWAEHEALYGHLPAIAEMARPRAKSARQVPAATRARLATRAEGLFGASRDAA